MKITGASSSGNEKWTAILECGHEVLMACDVDPPSSTTDAMCLVCETGEEMQ